MAGVETAADGKRLVGKPVTVITVNEEGKLNLHIEALRSVLLQEDVRNLPVVVLSVAGAFRTGKSSILNVLLRFPFFQFEDWLGDPNKPLEGFPWMSGSDPHTEGIVFWSHLLRATTADKKEVAVLLVDTEGSFGTSSSTAVSVHIFAFSVLISSIQIFNVMRNLQLDHLQHLQMYYKFGNYMKKLEGRTSCFQLCVFLVRDWPWPKEYEFGWEGGERLLQKILGVESKNKATDELRDLRTYLESCLSSRNCFLMPSPGLTDDGCSLNGAVNGISPSFKKHLRDFVRGVLSPSKLVVKTWYGVPLTALELCKFVEKMTPMFSSKELPKPALMVEKTDEFCAELVRDKALMEYSNSLGQVLQSSDGTIISPEELKLEEANLRKKALIAFDTAPCLKLNECKEKERESVIKQSETIFSDILKRYQDAWEKYEESKKSQFHLKIAAQTLITTARLALGCVAFVVTPTVPIATAVTTAIGVLAAAGTELAAAIANRQNEKDLADAARKLVANLGKKQS